MILGDMSVSEVVSPRRNGWSCPWHPLQCLAWLFIFIFTLLHFGILGHYMLGYWRVLVFGVAAIILGVLVVSKVMATTIDPAEPSVRVKLPKGKFSRPKFDPTKFSHVIQNNYCTLCRVNVSLSAKHCKSCDKCVEKFDHHCKWLNNCVGSRNYRWFMATIWSGIIGLFLFLLFSLSLFIVYFIDEDASLLRFNCNSPSNLTLCDSTLRVLGIRLPSGANPVFPALCAICVSLSLPALLLLGHLAFFHIYLKVRGQTTYEFFLQRREDSQGQRKPQGAPGPLRGGRMWGGKVNRVTPVDVDAGMGSDAGRYTSLDMPPMLSSPQSMGSTESAGITTFGRTPPLDMFPEAGNLTVSLTSSPTVDTVKLGSDLKLESDLMLEEISPPRTCTDGDDRLSDLLEPLSPATPPMFEREATISPPFLPVAGERESCAHPTPGEDESIPSTFHSSHQDSSGMSFPLHSTCSPAPLDHPLPPHGTPVRYLPPHGSPPRQDHPLSPRSTPPARQDNTLPPHGSPSQQDHPLSSRSTPPARQDHPLSPHGASPPRQDNTLPPHGSPSQQDHPLSPHSTPPPRQDNTLPPHGASPPRQDHPLPPHSTPPARQDNTLLRQDSTLPTTRRNISMSSLPDSSPVAQQPSHLLDSTPLSSRHSVTIDAATSESITAILMESPPIPVDRPLSPLPSLDGTGDSGSTPSGGEGAGWAHHVNVETPLHKRVSFHHSHQEERPSSKPRPLPPIGSSTCHDDPLPPRARRLPPLAPSDSLSLYSTSSSSHSQLFRPTSTHSLPIPDPRYSSASQTPGELEGSRRASPGLHGSSKEGRKGLGDE